MLLAEALVHVLELWDQDRLKEIPHHHQENRIAVISVQILNRTLGYQTFNRPEGLPHSHEVTAYAIQTLKALHSLPWSGPVAEYTISSIKKCQEFLLNCRSSWDVPQFLWIEKLIYGSQH